MLRPHSFALLVSLMLDGGVVSPQPAFRGADAGVAAPRPSPPGADAGVAAPRPSPPGADAGSVAPQPDTLTPGSDGGAVVPPPVTADSIPWPKEGEELQPLSVLEGPAVLAAHAALQHVLSRFPKKHTKSCIYSARALDVVVWQKEGLYFVRIDRRADRCRWPNAEFEFDWFELYAVSPDGRIFERFPYMP
jgi:hypothetical protein